MIVLPIAGGVILGHFIDDALGTRPYVTMILFSLGALVAIFQAGNVLSVAMKVIRRE
jgi:F0F1-type ATP synthase assembly protein I